MSQISTTDKTKSATNPYLASVFSEALNVIKKLKRQNEEMDTELWRLNLQMKKVKNHADQCDYCKEALTKK